MSTFQDVNKKDMDILIQHNLAIIELKTKYELMRLKGPVSAVLFKSGKLLIQGNDDAVKMYNKILKDHGFKEIKKIEFKKQEGVYIGSDETLKGDTFGGLVVAGVKANDEQRECLKILGVMDSKKITDQKIHKLAEEIKKIIKFSIKNIMPEEYNRSNQTELMNLLHAKVARDLGTGTERHVVDKYPGCNVGNIIESKAESKYIEVAAASILARSVGLKQLDLLSKRLNYPVPKGSTHVKEALEFLKESGKDPALFVKLHFNNVQKALF